MMNVPLGKAERLGSLAHEMTHVLISETFKNTSLYLAFDKGATDEEILELSQQRTEQLEALQGLMEGDDNLTSDMKALLLKKIRYPIEMGGLKATGDILRYANKPKFKQEMGDVMHGRIVSLAGRGLNNTVIEFDTVINQMMVYMTLWQIPLASSFYRKLIDVASEALAYRAGI
jgi:hypothetical protein